MSLCLMSPHQPLCSFRALFCVSPSLQVSCLHLSDLPLLVFLCPYFSVSRSTSPPTQAPHVHAFLISLPQFNPELVLVSAGFDAARGDPLGGCQVSPEGYAHLTHLLMGLASGRIILILEVTLSVPLPMVGVVWKTWSPTLSAGWLAATLRAIF